jgi:REP element-mobilizing transposase RayT
LSHLFQSFKTLEKISTYFIWRAIASRATQKQNFTFVFMSEKYKFRNNEGIYFVTPTVVHWIDVFTRKEYAYILVRSLNHCIVEKGLIVHGWCIMPSHLHLIVSCKEGFVLADIMRDFKIYTSKKIVEEISMLNESRKEWLLKAFAAAGKKLNRIDHYKFWQDGNHPVECDTAEILQQKLDYLHCNPVEAGIVAEEHHYLFSSAVDYAGGKGLVEVSLV